MTKTNVLFLCTGNSCRSQMAEGWARHFRGDKIEAYSAGNCRDEKLHVSKTSNCPAWAHSTVELL